MPVHLNGQNTTESQPTSPLDTADRPIDLAKLSRRSFIAACLAGCSQAALPSVPPMAPEPLAKKPERRGETWALLADPHISRKLDRKFGLSCMADNLRRVVDEVGPLAPDQLLVNGDIGYMHGRTEDYAAFLELVSPLRAIPTHLTLGNHDHRGRFVQSLPVAHDVAVSEKAVSSQRINDHRWLFLDSLDETHSVRGSLGPAQRAWLENCLNDDPHTPTILCLHHNPDLSPVGLTDYDEFERLVLPRRQVKLVLFGHTHIFRTWQTDGLHFVNLPAIGFRLRPLTSLGWMAANVEPDRAWLTFHGITGKELENGVEKELRWRSYS
ncbi:MAG TPA: metallophosphoesterase [Phycisphaerae bacterium]|nr:metallophosphoesterase [Phycisphaerae bacterium]